MSCYCRLLQHVFCIHHAHAVLHSKLHRQIVQGESSSFLSELVRYCTFLGFIPTSVRDLFSTVMSYSYYCCIQSLLFVVFSYFVLLSGSVLNIYFFACRYLNPGFFLGFHTPRKFGIMYSGHPFLCLIQLAQFQFPLMSPFWKHLFIYHDSVSNSSSVLNVKRNCIVAISVG